MTTAFLSFVMLAVAVLAPLTARGQDRTPGLTGADRSDDVVMARQLLMAGIDQEMGARRPGGCRPGFQTHRSAVARLHDQYAARGVPASVPAADEARGIRRRYRKRDGGDDGDLAEFRRVLQEGAAAAATAYDASQAADLDQFKDLAKRLRVACDDCHARYMRVDDPPRP